MNKLYGLHNSGTLDRQTRVRGLQERFPHQLDLDGTGAIHSWQVEEGRGAIYKDANQNTPPYPTPSLPA